MSAAYRLITPDDLHWRPSNLMHIPNADYLERTGSEHLGARLWRLPPPGSANTLHKHLRSEEFYVVLEGAGRLRVGEDNLTVPQYGGVWGPPESLRQVFNDTPEDVLWRVVGGPEEKEFLLGSRSPIGSVRHLPDQADAAAAGTGGLHLADAGLSQGARRFAQNRRSWQPKGDVDEA